MDTDKVLALAIEAGAMWEHGDYGMGSAVRFNDNADLYRFAALIQREMEAEGWRKPEIMQPSPFLRPPKFGQCIICGANHGGLPCPDYTVTSKERK